MAAKRSKKPKKLKPLADRIPAIYAAALQEVADREGLEKFTRYAAAQRCKVPSQTIYRWASGERQPSYADMQKFADALGLSVDITFKG